MLESASNVRVLKTLPELEEVRSLWDSWPGNRDSEIDSYSMFLRSSPTTVRPHVVVVYREGRPDAILVGRVDLGHIACRLGYLQLNLPAKVMCFVYGALRGNASRENCDLIVRTILTCLSNHEADVAYLNYLREGSPLSTMAKRKPGWLSRDYVHLIRQHYAAALPPSVDEFYAGLSPKVRKNQKWQAKKLVKHFDGNVTIRCFREAAEIDDLVADVERVASKSYQRGLGVGFVDGPEVRERLRFKADRGWLRGYVLYLGGRPAAFWLGDINGSTFGSDYIGYDAEFASHSPGMYLVMKVIENFCEAHCEEVDGIDFGIGYAQYKHVLSNREWREESVYIFAPTLKGITYNLTRTVIGRIDQTVKNLLTRTNLLQKVKKTWRHHAQIKEPARDNA